MQKKIDMLNATKLLKSIRKCAAQTASIIINLQDAIGTRQIQILQLASMLLQKLWQALWLPIKDVYNELQLRVSCYRRSDIDGRSYLCNGWSDAWSALVYKFMPWNEEFRVVMIINAVLTDKNDFTLHTETTFYKLNSDSIYGSISLFAMRGKYFWPSWLRWHSYCIVWDRTTSSSSIELLPWFYRMKRVPRYNTFNLY